jgi:hypothetical protein
LVGDSHVRPEFGSDVRGHLGTEQFDGPNQVGVADAADGELKERPLMAEDLVLKEDLLTTSSGDPTM